MSIVTGSSVIGLKFKDGVMLACDTLISYGGVLKYRHVSRIEQLEPDLFIAASGEVSDFQVMVELLRAKQKEYYLHDDGVRLSHQDYAAYLRNILYHYRTKMNPFNNEFVLVGFRDGQPLVYDADMYGNGWDMDACTAGFSKYFATPILNNNWAKDCSEEQALTALRDSFKMLFYRDCKAVDEIDVVIVKAGGAATHRFKVASDWDYPSFRNMSNERKKE